MGVLPFSFRPAGSRGRHRRRESGELSFERFHRPFPPGVGHRFRQRVGENVLLVPLDAAEDGLCHGPRSSLRDLEAAPVGAPGRGQAHRLLTRAVSYADGVLDAVTAQQLSRPTPCQAWNLRMLLEHAEESLAVLHEGLTVHRVAASPACTPAHPTGGASSAAALVSAFRQRATALLCASAQADSDLPVAVGGHRMPLDCLCATGALEIAVHAWDISQACGQRLPIPDEAATDLLVQARLLVPRLGRHPLFAAPVRAPPRSTSSDRLTAYLGRPGRDEDSFVGTSAADPPGSAALRRR
jgi:uncharacterized protein (TIGR03086 family)